MSVRIVGVDETNEMAVTISGSSLSGSIRVVQYDITGEFSAGGFSYDASIGPMTPPATPTDLCCIQGSDIADVAITRIRMQTTQTAPGNNAWYLIKRRTPNAGGTFFFITSSLGYNESGIKREDNLSSQSFDNLTGSNAYVVSSTPPTAVVTRYSANPTTLGNPAGTVRAGRLYSNNLTSSAATPTMIWDFDDFQTGPMVLHGSQENLCLNFNGVALPAGLSVTCNFAWKEIPHKHVP